MTRIRIIVIIRTMASLTHKGGIMKDIGGWVVRISISSLKFISIAS